MVNGSLSRRTGVPPVPPRTTGVPPVAPYLTVPPPDVRFFPPADTGLPPTPPTVNWVPPVAPTLTPLRLGGILVPVTGSITDTTIGPLPDTIIG